MAGGSPENKGSSEIIFLDESRFIPTRFSSPKAKRRYLLRQLALLDERDDQYCIDTAKNLLMVVVRDSIVKLSSGEEIPVREAIRMAILNALSVLPDAVD